MSAAPGEVDEINPQVWGIRYIDDLTRLRIQKWIQAQATMSVSEKKPPQQNLWVSSGSGRRPSW